MRSAVKAPSRLGTLRLQTRPLKNPAALPVILPTQLYPMAHVSLEVPASAQLTFATALDAEVCAPIQTTNRGTKENCLAARKTPIKAFNAPSIYLTCLDCMKKTRRQEKETRRVRCIESTCQSSIDSFSELSSCTTIDNQSKDPQNRSTAWHVFSKRFVLARATLNEPFSWNG